MNHPPWGARTPVDVSLATANLAVAAALCGLIWTIQLVHYPLFALVGETQWTRYEAEHQRRITWLVLPLMSANVLVALALLAERGDGAALANAVLAAGIFLTTGLVYAPLHGRLARAFAPERIALLVRLNWARTAAWSAQVGIALVIVAR